MPLYRDIELEAPDYEPMQGWSSDAESTEDLSEWLARRSSSEADAAQALSWLGSAVAGESNVEAPAGGGSEESA
jgi:hypothetical protein